MRFVLQTVKAQPAAQAKQIIPVSTAAPTAQPQSKHSTTTTTKQPTIITPPSIPTITPSTTATIIPTTKPASPILHTLPSTAARAAPLDEETAEAVDDEVRLRFDTTYSEGGDSSRRADEDEDSEGEDDQDEYGAEEEDEDDGVVGAPSVAINCSFSINPTSVLQRSMHCSQADDSLDEQAIEEAEEEEEEADEQQQEQMNKADHDQEEEEEEEKQYEESQQQEAQSSDAEEEEEEESKLRHFVAVDESLTHVVHSTTGGAESTTQDDFEEDDELDDVAFQLEAFQPHAIHIKPAAYYEEGADVAQHEAVAEEEDEQEAYDDEHEDGVSELCTVQIHQHSLITQANSQSHWNALNTPTRAQHNNNHYTNHTSPNTPHSTTASFTLNDSTLDPHNNLPPTPPSHHQPAAAEWDEAAHEARVAALQVELKERVEARRRKLRRASYMEEMEEKRLQKELEAKQRALQQLRLLRVKQEAEASLAALAAQKQKQAEEREQKDRKDKENQQNQHQQQQPQPQPQQQQLKRRSTSQTNNKPTTTQQQPTHTRTPSSLVMRKRIKQAHYDRLLKAVERGDTFTKYYDSWYCKPKPKFVRVVCLYQQAGSGSGGGGGGGGGGSGGGVGMKLTWGSDMFNMDKSLDLHTIVKVQRGSECAVAAKLPVELHSRAFSVTTSDGRTLHLVAATQATREVWLSFVLMVVEMGRQPLVELGGGSGEVKVVAGAGEEVKVGGESGGMGARVRRSMGARLSLGRLSLGGKNAISNDS